MAARTSEVGYDRLHHFIGAGLWDSAPLEATKQMQLALDHLTDPKFRDNFSSSIYARKNLESRMSVENGVISKAANEKTPFPVHLSASEIAASDEYSGADPYSVEENLTGPFHQRRISLTVELLRDIGSPARILDVGCGEGYITGEIKRAFPNADVHGMDYSLSAVRKAHASFPEISFSVGDALQRHYPEGPFDVVVYNNLWEHVTDPIGLVSRAKDVLCPDGYVIVSTPSRFRTSNLVRAMLGKKIRMMSKHHVTEYTVGQVKEQFAWAGFEVLNAFSRTAGIGMLRSRVVGRIFSAWARLVGSHHQLEATVFFLARMKKEDAVHQPK